jgi:hypothetical protein
MDQGLMSADCRSEIEGHPAMTKIKCLDCQNSYGMTWDNQRHQFVRLIRRGLSRDEIKVIMPRCGKCVTAWLRRAADCRSDDPNGRSGRLSL